MLRFTCLAYFIAICSTSFAGLTNSVPVASNAEKSAKKQRIYERTGGNLIAKGTPAGLITIVDTQDKVSYENFDITDQTLGKNLKSVLKYMRGKPVSIDTVAAEFENLKTTFALFIIYDKSLPPSLIAPEARWAIMNVAALEPGATTAEVTRIRARNEFARVLAILCGSYTSQFSAPLFNDVKSIEDLDHCLSSLPVDVATRAQMYAEFCGVKPAKRVTYRRACQEGWAPAPTNDIQKAIWDKVHAPPSNPMRIQFDPKKGR